MIRLTSTGESIVIGGLVGAIHGSDMRRLGGKRQILRSRAINALGTNRRTSAVFCSASKAATIEPSS
jgi:hypothetical protein